MMSEGGEDRPWVGARFGRAVEEFIESILVPGLRDIRDATDELSRKVDAAMYERRELKVQLAWLVSELSDQRSCISKIAVIEEHIRALGDLGTNQLDFLKVTGQLAKDLAALRAAMDRRGAVGSSRQDKVDERLAALTSNIDLLLSEADDVAVRQNQQDKENLALREELGCVRAALDSLLQAGLAAANGELGTVDQTGSHEGGEYRQAHGRHDPLTGKICSNASKNGHGGASGAGEAGS